ncbi:putative sodium/bile acid symporter family (mazG-like) [Burkholderiales bacterium 8X]|nr:putative sodium/bile acid symporter family (mazG-like) [Burkholderiales bacterium 8X]
MTRPRFLPDNFMLMLLCTVALASLFPAQGRATDMLKVATTVAISLLFFLHGAKLSRSAILAGLGHWRAHLMVFSATFLLFPLIGWGLQPVLSPFVTPELYVGFLFLCVLPSTVQSSIALTALARGNMPAAICAASASTLLGIVITPFLVGLLLAKGAAMADPLATMGRIAMQLLLPFVAGHLLQPVVGEFVKRRASVLKFVDQGSILLVVYAAFSHAVIDGLWSALPLPALAGLAVLCAVLLGLVLSLLTWACRMLGFSKEDEVSIVFCGSQKSLISGVPMANVLFSASAAGAIVLPLMVYHQMQLMVCAVLARRYARRPEDRGAADPAGAPAGVEQRRPG